MMKQKSKARRYKTSWQSWLAGANNFSKRSSQPVQKFIENQCFTLAVTGRALDHRVWQSIEYYCPIADVNAAHDKDTWTGAMHVAFGDQLVQKVIPKLRY